MKITIIGGGPGGLYTAILAKKAFPAADIAVHEKNPEGVTWGWGVVFSDETMGGFGDADPPTHRAIDELFIQWKTLDIFHHDRLVQSSGHAFCAIRRMKLLQILQDRARDLGVTLRFGQEVESVDAFSDSDLIVVADGINSKVRDHYAEHFQPKFEPGTKKFIWLGTPRLFSNFTFITRRNEHGLFQVHAYRFDKECSTFIVECSEDTWRNAGLDQADERASLAYCEQLFAEDLQGQPLLSNNSAWITFRRLTCATWHHRNVVLLGDAAHTAHFAIGSGTKLAMEDAIALVAALREHDQIGAALAAYQDARWDDVARLQRTAVVARRWFENVERYDTLPTEQFAASMLTRSKRVTHGNLRLRDPAYVEALDRWFARQAGHDEEPVPPPMFTRFSLRGMELRNRVVVSPMCQYMANDGSPSDWTLVHLGARAVGGAGLVITEMTAIAEDSRITPGCAGIYRDEHVAAWRRVVEFVHEHSGAKMALQLGHAGRKGATQRPWEGCENEPLAAGGWELLAPSALAWAPRNPVPRAMDRADMDRVRTQYVEATRRAVAAGFDMLEIHGAHGYLLSSFISPLSNRRTDAYGGSLANRMRFPLEVFDAVREAWPEDRPISVRISATDWACGGLEGDDAVQVAKLLREHGCDLVDVSTGQTCPEADPVYGRMYQTPFADQIRLEAGIATMAVGNIQGWDHVNTIIVSGRADLCALARPHLYDPSLTLHAAAEQGFQQHMPWPPPYRAAASVADRIATEAGFETD